jgi:hypothetical protein
VDTPSLQVLPKAGLALCGSRVQKFGASATPPDCDKT